MTALPFVRNRFFRGSLVKSRTRHPFRLAFLTTTMSSSSRSKREASGDDVKESVIRKMTRLAQEHGAVNLSQGFPNEAPPMDVRLALAHAVLTGRPIDLPPEKDDNGDTANNNVHLRSMLRSLCSISDSEGSTNSDITVDDVLNQYSPPMGRSDVRSAIATYYERFYNFAVDEDNITVTLGATEALASALRSLGKPGDKAVVFEPFHELYPSQCKLFYLDCHFVTLRPSDDGKTWTFDPEELERTLKDAKILLLNTPHNPTGKIFTREEIKYIVELCLKYDVYIVTDEIYEHMCYSEENEHIFIPQQFPEMVDRCLICNSMGKSASATGWRLGWCVHPSHISSTYRGIHDQLAVMSPHPMQYATLTYLALPDGYFRELKTRYKQRLSMLASTLQEVGFGVIFPEGAYYLFVNYRPVEALSPLKPMDAATYLLKEAGVACVPGDNFYGKAIRDEGNQYLRFAACRSEEDIREACNRLRKSLS